MLRPCEGWPDWRDPRDYAALLEAERPAIAWEWLRRTREYREEHERARKAGAREREERAARWGLHAFEAPGLASQSARPIWRRDRFAFVLEATAGAGGPPEDRLDLGRVASFATLWTGSEGEHLLLSDGLRQIRLDILSGTLADGPARLRYRLEGFAAASAPVLVLRRLTAFARCGRFSRALHVPDPRASRWIALLRAHDALEAGATQRDIAEVLLGEDATARRWRSAAPSLRSRAQRLVRGARAMSRGGYAALLERNRSKPRPPE